MTSALSRGPVPLVDPAMAYERPPVPAGVSLRLDANEGIPAFPAEALQLDAEVLRRYPDARPLEAQLAQRYALEPSQVFVAAGADEVIDRCCRVFLAQGSTLLMAEPGFEMFPRYATLSGASTESVSWSPTAFPVRELLSRVSDQTRVIAIVSPNNPTGDVATADDLQQVASAAPDALVILDHAYVEFADSDLTLFALTLPNVIVVRTFSKAWGVAGCRVGYALGPTALIRPLRAAGSPFPVSSLSLAVASECLVNGVARQDAYVSRIRHERNELYRLLKNLNAAPRPSQGNFLFAELGARSRQVHASLIRGGVLVKQVSNKSGDPLGLRISLPGDDAAFATLCATLSSVLKGEPS
jgi:histidinol-phosphate aminotransferase